MRWLCLGGVALLSACGSAEVRSQKLHDGSYEISCELPMDQCIFRVQDQCRNQRYRILEGTSEVKLVDAPPFEKAYHASRLHLVCSADGGRPLLGREQTSAAKPAPASDIVCTTGETRTCVGPGACKGGQACSPDRQGFGACDCGAVTPAAPALEPAPPTPPVETSPPTAAP
ncbi:MAG: hypothetical protein ABJB12_15705 [Pseudomonadota bacterium]